MPNENFDQEEEKGEGKFLMYNQSNHAGLYTFDVNKEYSNLLYSKDWCTTNYIV